MSQDIYKDAIVTLAKAKTGAERLNDPHASVTLDNPLCGDRITLDLKIEDGAITEIGHRVRGCMLCEAAASMIGQHAVGTATSDIAAARAALAGVLAASIGQAMWLAGREREPDLRRIEALAVVAGTWLVVALLGSVPYLWVGLAPVDAVFESMSGFTTTGATIFTDFSLFGRGLLFWRSLTQWLGGMGVITLFVAILPRLAMGVGRIFFAEAPGPTDEKLTPHIRQTAVVLWRLYAGSTLAEVLALWVAGMPSFGGPPESMSPESTLVRSKSVVGHSYRQTAGLAMAEVAKTRSAAAPRMEPRTASIIEDPLSGAC